jgi:hypothetical protein
MAAQSLKGAKMTTLEQYATDAAPAKSRVKKRGVVLL